MRSSSKTNPTRIRKPQVPRNRRWHDKRRTYDQIVPRNNTQPQGGKKSQRWKQEEYKTKRTSRTPRRRQCTCQRPHIKGISAKIQRFLHNRTARKESGRNQGQP